MSPRDKLILHYMKLYTDAEGEFVVGRADVGVLLSVTDKTAHKAVENLVRLGYVSAIKKPFAIGRGNGYKWVYHITERGHNAHAVHEDDCMELYHSHHSDRLIAELKKARLSSKSFGRKIKVAKGQKTLW